MYFIFGYGALESLQLIFKVKVGIRLTSSQDVHMCVWVCVCVCVCVYVGGGGIIIQPKINRVKKSRSCRAKYDYLHTEKHLTTIPFASI